ncbi:glutamyl-tRNA(Gln) amidotransferase subunit B, mitochondrial-like isoform X3 [Macrobrachium nipponense]|uniref:glutamyl-tRNA(Gln) amidotransferase subunit B, mitochondrial-like isoform X3 n=1 Tax=Macrobrachium nipponense TaxID=159736 RepID=UPI0030C7B641
MKFVCNCLKSVNNFRYYGTTQFKPALIRDMWQPVIGLEVHAQILSASKLFSRVGAKYGAPPNTQVGIFEAAHPGTLPILNKRCVEAAIKTALALQAQVIKVSHFDRKHYFYPDLPDSSLGIILSNIFQAGYQITQKDSPVAKDGCISFNVPVQECSMKFYSHAVRLTQLQLEEDSGKSIHDAKSNRVLVDLNRAGLPLMELVFAPDLRDGEEAAALIKELSLILTRVGTCSCRMEEGALRIDANISVHKQGEPLGERTEVKNLNSIRSLVKAINYEIQRQIDILEAGGTVLNETLRFDAINNTTIKMRDKDTIHDYRFMPEPNLPPLRLHDSLDASCIPNSSLDINDIRMKMNELPEETRQRLISNYGISLEDAIILVNDDALVEYFLDVMSATNSHNGQLVSNLLLNNLLGTLNSLDVDIKDSILSPSAFAEIVHLLESGQILHAVALKIMELICFSGDKRTPSKIVEMSNWTKLPDDLLEDYVLEVISSNKKLVGKYRRGNSKVFNTLMGKAVAATERRADMQKLQDLLKRKLDE